jgi:serine/threonine-protein kinase
MQHENQGNGGNDLIGRSFGNYQITGFLGQGGMARVYRAEQSSMGRSVAIKVVPSAAHDIGGTLQRFEQEVRLIAGLQHPRILPVYDFGQADGWTYLVMRIVESGTLADRLAKGPLDAEAALYILDQLASALDYAHQRGIIHRDLKPANVFLDEGNNVYLADFGLAKLLGRVDTQLTASGYVLGTPAYMSPEQITDQPIDRRVDVYALGLILFEMLTGEQVFSGSTPTSVIFKHVSESPPIPSSRASYLTPEIDAVVLKALAKSPGDRYSTAGELANAFRIAMRSPFTPDILADESWNKVPGPPAPESLSVPQQASSSSAPRRWVWGGVAFLTAGGVLALVALIVFGILALRNLPGSAASIPPTTETRQETPTVSLVATATPQSIQEATATPVVEQPTPTLELTNTSLTPTVTPVPTTTPQPTPVETLGQERVGRAQFLTVQKRLDTVQLQLAGIEPAPTGKHYEAWLTGTSAGMLNLGKVAPDGNRNVDHSYTDPEGRNLAGLYNGISVSLEPDFGDTPEIGEVVLEGAVSETLLPIIREVVFRSSDRPLHSLLDGLETETTLGQDHLGFAIDGLSGGNLSGGLGHVEHVLNILLGEDDPRFGDLNNDQQTQNPGDGYGVLGYLRSIQDKVTAAGQANTSSEELRLHTEYSALLVANTQQRTEGIVSLLLRAFAQDSASSALTLANQALALYTELETGSDLNGNQTIEPIEGEGGITLLAQHAGYLANIEVYRVAAQ